MKTFNVRRLCYLTFTLFVFMSVQSCHKGDLVPGDISAVAEPSVEITSLPKISADIVELTADDAVIVANIFSRSSVATRSSGNLSVKDVITVNDSNGEPAIYAVNYEDGYVLVSATKKYCPILAEVEHGRFSINSGTGQDILVGDYIRDIEYVKNDSSVDVEKSQWRQYEEVPQLDLVKTRVANDDYYDMIEPYILNWQREGRKVYFMRNKPENMPEDLYELFCSIAYTDMPDVPGYSYLDCAIITEYEYEYVSEVKPLLQTTWAQGYPFNASLDNTEHPLGCVTIAVGQIMRYHEYPANYSWGSMPNSASNTILSDFLRKLHDDLKVDDGGGSNINHAKRVFNKYGYEVTMINHDMSAVTKSLNKNNPVYMRGRDTGGKGGHAWVCDGEKFIQSRTDYRMYELILSFGSDLVWRPSRMEEFASETIFGFTYNRYHMNWGWYGYQDGYFLDNYLKVDTSEGLVNLSSDRKELIISKN